MFAGGQTLAGRYDIERLLGAGGLATAYLARDRSSDADVALKVVSLEDAASVDNLRREFALLRGLHHPHLVEALDLAVDRSLGVAFSAFGYVAGPTLERVGSAEARQALVDALDALAFLHSLGIRHGDFKPENVVVTGGRGTLIDLSCAAPLGVAVAVSGTPGFLAPELLRGEPGDARADVYAVGVTLRRLGLCDDGELLEAATAADCRARVASAVELKERLGGERPLTGPRGRAARLHGRDAELRWLTERIDAFAAGAPGPRALALFGAPGSGTSRLLAEAKWLAQLRVDRVAVAREGALEVPLEGASLEARLRRLEALSEGPERVVLLTDAGASDDAEALARTLEPDAHVLLVFVTRRAPSGLEALEVGPLSPEAVAGWAAPFVDPAEFAALHASTGGFAAAVAAHLSRPGAALTPAQRLAVPREAGLRAPLLALALAQRALGREALATLGVDAAALLDLQARGWVRLEADRRATLARPSEAELIAEAFEAPERVAMHRRLAAASQASWRALHLAGAGAIEAAVEALDGIDASLDPEGARRAVDALARSSPAHALRAADLHAAVGDPRRALGWLAAALRRRPFGLERAAIHRRAAHAYVQLGRADRALAELRRASRHEPGSAARAEHSDAHARALRQLGRYAEAYAVASAARLEFPDDVRLAEAAGVAATFLGDADAARRHLAVAEADAAGPARARVRVLSYLAILDFREGKLAPAIERYEAVLALAERSALPDQVASAASNLGAAEQQRGELGAARDHYERALRLARALGKRSSETTLRFNLASLLHLMGASARAERALSRCRAMAREDGQVHVVALCDLLEGELHLAADRWPEARRAFASARDGLAPEMRREGLELALLEAELTLREGRPQAAADALRVAVALEDDVAAEDLTLRRRALEARVIGIRDPSGALRLLERVLERAQAGSHRLLEASVARALADTADELGAGTLALRHRRAARATLERVAATLPAEERDAFYRHHGAPPLEEAPVPARGGLDLRRFLAINKRLSAAHSLDVVLEHAMDAAIELTGAERGFVLLAGPPLEVRVARNLDRERVSQSHHKFSHGVAASVIAEDEPVLTTDAAADARFAGNASVHAMRLRSIACVPIRGARGTVGALYLDHRFHEGTFAGSDLATLEAFADQVAIAMENARLIAELEQRTSELERTAEELASEKARVERLLVGREAHIVELSEAVAVRQRALEHRYDYRQIVGRGRAMSAVLDTLDRVIDADVSVLITGESGTGKELVARAVHYNGARRDGPFVSINCGALPETLLESELFGHVRGAFTGADRDREGLLEAARGGMLFLDEVAEMSAAMQVKLLRVLQEREVRPLGATEPRAIDVRVLAATHRDLGEAVAAGAFRADLFYRLGVVMIALPPLRERPEDLVPLARAIVERLAERRGVDCPPLEPTLLAALLAHRWPGNVRELENALTRAFVLGGGARLDESALGLTEAAALPASRADYEAEEARVMRAALVAHRWNVRATCRALGVPSNTFYRKLKRYGIERP